MPKIYTITIHINTTWSAGTFRPYCLLNNTSDTMTLKCDNNGNIFIIFEGLTDEKRIQAKEQIRQMQETAKHNAETQKLLNKAYRDNKPHKYPLYNLCRDIKKLFNKGNTP